MHFYLLLFLINNSLNKAEISIKITGLEFWWTNYSFLCCFCLFSFVCNILFYFHFVFFVKLFKMIFRKNYLVHVITAKVLRPYKIRKHNDSISGLLVLPTHFFSHLLGSKREFGICASIVLCIWNVAGSLTAPVHVNV